MSGSRFKRGDHKRPGPAPTHGGFSEVRRYRERKTDLRTADDRALRDWQNAITRDLGGLANMDALQASLLDRATECLIILRCMSQWVEKEGIMVEGGLLAPCLRHSYISYMNSFRLTLEKIYERADRRPPKGPKLKDIIEAASSGKDEK